ncbi:sporulation protein [Occultella glacieicola]|uniref:Sporulation protein n=1 Tax=Occultella glacieicola TaxID=2518684 RepID=A0ABY2DYA1_9MICO|nr:spore germination protein GerW family protein [Occultella glacieicola]TDE88814.1 sporulation protein [Occultella glacieicola]
MNTSEGTPDHDQHPPKPPRPPHGDPRLPIEAARDALTVKRVFGEAYSSDGATVIPVAKVYGGAGMGYGDGAGMGPSGEGAPHAEGSGGGGGFGVLARPAGVYVVRDGKVSWQPALDVNRAILGGQILGAIVAVSVACVLRTRLRRRRG